MLYGVLDKEFNTIDCPLERVKVNVNMDTDISYVNITQEYFHKGNSNIEGIYCFPMIHNGQVTDFTIKIGKSMIKGEFEESEVAYRIYENSIRKGDTSFLLDSQSSDALQISLGNIPPKERIAITITYTEDLKITDDNIRWLLPTTIAPRYTPIDMPTELNNELRYGKEDYYLDLKINIECKDKIDKISSPSHGIQVSNGKDNILIQLVKEYEPLDRDFVLNLQVNSERENSLFVGKEGDEYFGELRIVPQLDLQDANYENREYVFLLDISGSMEGEKIEQGKRALNIALRNLIEGDKFNIIAFNSYYEAFEDIVVPYSNDNLLKAQDWIKGLHAYGGTEIYSPLKYALRLPENHMDRVIFLFTDGQVNNEIQIFHLAKEYSSKNRIYPFGIDTAINKYFIDELAISGNGLAEYIYPGERIEDKVINQLSRINQPYYSQVKIRNYFGEEIEVYPLIPIKLYNGEEYKFIFKGKSEEDFSYLIFEAMLDNQKIKMKIDRSSDLNGKILATKWAKEYIKYLESLLNKDNKRREKLLKEDIIRASKEYGVLSSLTSLLAVYEGKGKNRGYIDTVWIPLSLPQEWHLYNNNLLYQSSPSIKYNEAQIYESNSFSISLSESKRSFDETKELMLDVAAVQNANGSFMDDESKTAYYLIAMLLFKEENRPYKSQMNKALNYLLSSSKNDLIVYLALKLAYVNQYSNDSLYSRITLIENSDEIGNYAHIFNLLENSVEEFSSILFDESFNRKELINFLFNMI